MTRCDLTRFHPNFDWGWASHLYFSSIDLTSGLAARRLFLVSPSCKGTIRLQTSMPSPGFKPRHNGTAGSVTKHYTGWAVAALNHEFQTISKH
ncbi:hypothetical protein TNCV_2115201 [Trichonephila clavipes]|nr:hypothetical protein TNCV_2115201 [Trichonephila clavipes]